MASGSDSEIILPPNSDVAEREFVLKLISLYRENSVLWDTNNEHYTNKYRRILALKKICDCLKQYKPNYTIDELKKKMNILRTNFNKERNKIERRKSMSPEEDPEPILWYFNEMTFLTGQEMPTKVSNRYNKTEEPSRTKILNNLKRKKISIISESSTGIKKAENEEEILAKFWAMKLRKLNRDQRLFAEKIINDTLFEAEMGTLTRHGASFNVAPAVWTQFSTESHSPVYKSPSSHT